MSKELTRMRVLTKIFDELLPIPGTKQRIGLDALMGLLPGGGDVVGGLVSAYAILIAGRMGAPAPVILRMALNIVIDAIVGAVPFLGDLFDVAWKANRKNLALLQQYAAAPAATRRSSMLAVVVAIIMVLALVVAIGAGTVWLIRQIIGLL